MGHGRCCSMIFWSTRWRRPFRPDEVLTDIRVPRPLPHTGSAYLKLERKVGDYAIAAVGVQITLAGGVCSRAGIGLTNVGPKAIRASAGGGIPCR